MSEVRHEPKIAIRQSGLEDPWGVRERAVDRQVTERCEETYPGLEVKEAGILGQDDEAGDWLLLIL